MAPKAGEHGTGSDRYPGRNTHQLERSARSWGQVKPTAERSPPTVRDGGSVDAEQQHRPLCDRVLSDTSFEGAAWQTGDTG